MAKNGSNRINDLDARSYVADGRRFFFLSTGCVVDFSSWAGMSTLVIVLYLTLDDQQGGVGLEGSPGCRYYDMFVILTTVTLFLLYFFSTATLLKCITGARHLSRVSAHPAYSQHQHRWPAEGA